MRVTNAANYDEPRDSLSHDWSRLASSMGLSLVPVPNIGADSVAYLSEQSPDLLILSGGEDIGTSPLRDETEAALLKYAIDNNLPTLGVCRGLQFLNYFFDGRLGSTNGHVATPHDVTVQGQWKQFYGPSVVVNSFHNACIPVDGLAPVLVPTAYDSAGNIEAAQHDELPLYGVMWHPERHPAAAGDQNMIRSLLRHRS